MDTSTKQPPRLIIIGNTVFTRKEATDLAQRDRSQRKPRTSPSATGPS